MARPVLSVSRSVRLGGVLLVLLCALSIAPAQTEIPSEERAAVKARVEALEARFRRLRDDTLADCRGVWSTCTNRHCKEIAADRWRSCQDTCDAEYERCKRVAYEYWPEGE